MAKSFFFFFLIYGLLSYSSWLGTYSIAPAVLVPVIFLPDSWVLGLQTCAFTPMHAITPGSITDFTYPHWQQYTQLSAYLELLPGRTNLGNSTLLVRDLRAFCIPQVKEQNPPTTPKGPREKQSRENSSKVGFPHQLLKKEVAFSYSTTKNTNDRLISRQNRKYIK